MKAEGVRTLYLETSNWRQSADVVRPRTLAALVEAAHAQGIQVVAWYLPSYKPVRTDLRRSLNAIGFTTATGQRFDGFALDIESTEVGSIPLRNRLEGRLARSLRRSVGPDYPLGAIVPEAGALYWPGFPYAQTARYFDVFLPMAYFTFRVQGAAAVRSYTARNIATIRSLAGASTPIHPIGGLSDQASTSEVAAYVRAARSGGAIGASLYEFNGTSSAAWSQLARFPSQVPAPAPGEGVPGATPAPPAAG
jgi:hypothetical protein